MIDNEVIAHVREIFTLLLVLNFFLPLDRGFLGVVVFVSINIFKGIMLI